MTREMSKEPLAIVGPGVPPEWGDDQLQQHSRASTPEPEHPASLSEHLPHEPDATVSSPCIVACNGCSSYGRRAYFEVEIASGRVYTFAAATAAIAQEWVAILTKQRWQTAAPGPPAGPQAARQAGVPPSPRGSVTPQGGGERPPPP